MNPAQLYRIAGLTVASAIALDGVPHAPPGAETDLTIHFGAVPAALEGASEVHATYQIAADRMLLHIPHIARFALHAGREIVVDREAQASDGDLAAFIVGTVLGIALHQRARIVLHASAVRVGDRAVLFCGSSGAGKSALAAALALKGYPVIADDLCAIDGLVVHPDDGGLKLWTHTIDALDLGARRGGPVRAGLQKFHVATSIGETAALPAAAFYVLRDTRPPAKNGVERVNIVDASILFRKSAYRPRLVRLLGQTVPYLQASAALIAAGAGVHILNRPLDFKTLPGAIAGLEAHWRALGLVAS